MSLQLRTTWWRVSAAVSRLGLSFGFGFGLRLWSVLLGCAARWPGLVAGNDRVERVTVLAEESNQVRQGQVRLQQRDLARGVPVLS